MSADTYTDEDWEENSSLLHQKSKVEYTGNTIPQKGWCSTLVCWKCHSCCCPAERWKVILFVLLPILAVIAGAALITITWIIPAIVGNVLNTSYVTLQNSNIYLSNSERKIVLSCKLYINSPLPLGISEGPLTLSYLGGSLWSGKFPAIHISPGNAVDVVISQLTPTNLSSLESFGLDLVTKPSVMLVFGSNTYYNIIGLHYSTYLSKSIEISQNYDSKLLVADLFLLQQNSSEVGIQFSSVNPMGYVYSIKQAKFNVIYIGTSGPQLLGSVDQNSDIQLAANMTTSFEMLVSLDTEFLRNVGEIYLNITNGTVVVSVERTYRHTIMNFSQDKVRVQWID